MHPLPVTLEQNAEKVTSISSFTVVIFILLGMAILPASFITFVVREKETKSKHQQVGGREGGGEWWRDGSMDTWILYVYVCVRVCMHASTSS